MFNGPDIERALFGFMAGIICFGVLSGAVLALVGVYLWNHLSWTW